MPKAMFRLTEERRQQQFRAFRDGDANVKDVYVRVAIVIATGLALWVATRHWIMPFWAVGYAVLNIWHVWMLRESNRSIAELPLELVTFNAMFISLWYYAMVIYIGVINGGDFLVLSACGFVGGAFHCLAQTQDFNFSSLIDFVSAWLCGVAVFALAAWYADTFWSGLSTMLGGLFVLVYFSLAFMHVVSDRRQVKLSLRADTQNQKMRALGQLTSGIAHDFNNLLAVIVTNIELALHKPRDDSDARLLGNVQLAANNGAELVRQLMTYVRKADLKTTAVDLAELTERLAFILPRVLPPQIELNIAEDRSGSRLRADSAILETALLNLVINARDAIGDKPGRIAIEIEPGPGDHFLSLCVTDTGPGMRKEVLERASDPFFTTKEVGEGSGLGLSMVKGFAEQSGGQLILKNREPTGLRASLLLPVMTAEPATLSRN